MFTHSAVQTSTILKKNIYDQSYLILKLLHKSLAVLNIYPRANAMTKTEVHPSNIQYVHNHKSFKSKSIPLNYIK